MKKLNLLIATLTFFVYGCGDPFRHLENLPPLKSENGPDESSSGALQNTPIACNFSTTVATKRFPEIVWPSTYPNSEAKQLKLHSETAMAGYSSFVSSKTTDFTKTERQKDICDQIENEFVGFDNPYYRRQHYSEEYSVERLEQVTKNLRTNEYATIKPDKAFFAVEYADPKGDTKEPIKLKTIPIEITCKDGIEVRTSEYNHRGFKFRHSNKCDFEAVNQEYTLNNGEKIKLSIVGSLGSDSEGLVLKIKEVSWRDAK